MTRTRAFVPGWLVYSVAPADWVFLGFMLLACLGLWANSAKLLVASAWRDNGRVLSCTYFTGTRVVELQYSGTASGADHPACPIAKLG